MPEDELFRDRLHAGTLLAERLLRYRGAGALVLGIPRGGVAVAATVARRLGAELDVAIARKLGALDQPELALGAVTANGVVFLNEDVISRLHVSRGYLKQIIAHERAEACARQVRFRGTRTPPRVRGRTVIVVDDGLATGATMRAVVRSLRQEEPRRLVVAVPVGAAQTCSILRTDVDEVECVYEADPLLVGSPSRTLHVTASPASPVSSSWIVAR